MGIPDNYDLWERQERRREKWLAGLPVCCRCGEPIQGDIAYHPETGEEMCPECLEEYEEENER